MGELVFTKFQYGAEVTPGSAVASTAIWPGAPTPIPPDRKVQRLPVQTGRRGGSISTAIAQHLVDPLTLKMDAAYIEKLPMLMAMLLDGTVAAGAGKWVYTPVLTAAPTLKTFTLEAGDDTQAFEIEYLSCRSVKISGRTGEDGFVSVEAECFGRQMGKTTFTGGLTTGTLTPLVANFASFWLDPTWATLGSTAKTGLLREWEIEITNGLHPKFMADGQRYFSSIGLGELDFTATLVYEGNASAVTEYDAYLAKTARAMRLLVGNATDGLQIDLYGAYETVQPMGKSQDGNNLYIAVLAGLDDNQATPHKLAVTVNTASTSL